MRTKVLITAVALLTTLFVSLPTAQGQANATPLTVGIQPVGISTIASGVLGTAENYIGTRYCRGGATPRCFDCSGFVEYVFAQEGIDLPRTAHQQYKSVTPISREEAQPGDLVFFKYRNGWIHHVGIYVGDGKVLHSPRRGGKVRIEEIWTGRVVFGRV